MRAYNSAISGSNLTKLYHATRPAWPAW